MLDNHSQYPLSHLTFTLLITSRKNTISKIAYYPSFTVWILLFWQSAAHTKKQNKNKQKKKNTAVCCQGEAELASGEVRQFFSTESYIW